MPRVPREKIIGRIVKMEERIGQCRRCSEYRQCCPRPSLGRGDIEARILVVFPHENDFTRNQAGILRMREMLMDVFGRERKVYHTYMVRCLPRICNHRKSSNIVLDGTCVSSERVCLLTRRPCDGVPCSPGDAEAINCLHFLLEEIEILAPEIILPLGDMTSEYLFRAFGILDSTLDNFAEARYHVKRSGKYVFIPIDAPDLKDDSLFSRLKGLTV